MIGTGFFKKVFSRKPQRISGKLLVTLWFVMVVASAVVNIYLAQNHAETVAMEQARTMFNHIVLTRNWNALHGGVYVPITESTQPNPYLKLPDRDVVTQKDTKFTMINPAFMTRQLSELATRTKGVQFHITSLNPIRPQNKPELWEKEALERFEKGEKEMGKFVYDDNQHRYMAPLITTSGCLECHLEQGYKLGDIRGGISVTHQITDILNNRDNMVITTLLVHFIVLIMSCLAIVFYLRDQQRFKQLSVEKDGVDQANEFKRAFIANISHELRTPLNAIIGMSHILIDGKLDTGQLANAKKINQAGKQLNTMINHMLDFSQHQTGNLKLTVAPLQLRKLVDESVELMQEKAVKKGLSLDTEFMEGLPAWLLGDAKHIQQVLFHILDNAIKFTDKGSVRVTVSSRSEDENTHYISIVVKDSGSGMKELSKWFEQHDFSQIENSSTRTQGGIGLGLTMSRRLLALMDGDIQIISEEGVGTTVTITLKLEGVNPEENEVETGSNATNECKLTSAENGASESTEAEHRILSQEERQQLSDQLTELLGALDSDISRAMEILESIVEQYQGSDFSNELKSLSRMLDSFDNDGVITLCHSIKERILNAC